MTCLLLENGLPDSIDGVAIYPDYRNMIRFEQILDDDALNDVEKTILGVKQLFEELPPGGMARAVDRLQWFYRRGRDPKDGRAGAGKSNARAYDLVMDAGCIYASFLQAYHIDLTKVRFLHWWAFTSLLENLPEDTPMAQRMHLRTMELSEIKDTKLRQQYQKMQKRVALPRKSTTRGQRAERLSDRVKRRHTEAKKELERRKQHGL